MTTLMLRLRYGGDDHNKYDKEADDDDGDANNALPLGNACGHRHPDACSDTCTCEGTFQILQPGAWQAFADDAGHGDALLGLVESKASVSWGQVLRLVGVHVQQAVAL